MNLETKKTVVNKSQKDFFEYLSNFKNFEKLMPESIEKFIVEEDSFLFALKGMPEIRLVLKEKQEFDKLVLGSASGKLNFSLEVLIDEISESSCETQLLFKGDFNPMMAMMVKKPLQKFIDTLSQRAENL